MSLVKTIKAMVEEGYTISFSEADLPMDGIYITIKKAESMLDKLFRKTNWNL